jgi:hypothetical protein
MKDFTKWLNNYARKTGGGKIIYLLVPELCKDGAWHLHGLMNGVPKEHLSPSEKGKRKSRLADSEYSLNWKAYEQKFGRCRLFDKIRNIKAIAGYISKSVEKGTLTRKRGLYHRLYYCSQGLTRSKEVDRGYNLLPVDNYDFENEWVAIKMLNKRESKRFKRIRRKNVPQPTE